MKPTVVILTYNSGDSIANTLASIASLTDDVHVVDSGSADRTCEIVSEFGAHLQHHAFLNYGDQRNWAIANVTAKYPWQLHLDADEALSAALREEIAAIPEDTSVDGFFLPRYLKFMNKVLKHNLAPTWHMRLFREGKGSCEQREYDQHFLCTGTTAQLKNAMIDDIRMSLSEWTFRHNRWSDAEVKEILARKTDGRVEAKAFGNVVERKRHARGFYDRAPLFLRSFALFLYRYIFRCGFLDGKEGLIFCVLQTLWFRFLVDAKIYEATSSAPPPVPR